jgi:hypothetical protein
MERIKGEARETRWKRNGEKKQKRICERRRKGR